MSGAELPDSFYTAQQGTASAQGQTGSMLPQPGRKHKRTGGRASKAVADAEAEVAQAEAEHVQQQEHERAGPGTAQQILDAQASAHALAASARAPAHPASTPGPVPAPHVARQTLLPDLPPLGTAGVHEGATLWDHVGVPHNRFQASTDPRLSQQWPVGAGWPYSAYPYGQLGGTATGMHTPPNTSMFGPQGQNIAQMYGMFTSPYGASQATQTGLQEAALYGGMPMAPLQTQQLQQMHLQ